MSTQINYALGFNNFAVGSQILQSQWSEYEYDPVRGEIVHAESESVGYVSAQLAYQALKNQGIACKLRLERGKGTVSLLDSTLANSLDDWQMKPNDELIDPLLNPLMVQNINLWLAVYNGDNDTDFNLFDIVAAVRSNLADDTSAEDAFSGQPLVAVSDSALYEMYSDLQAGLQGFRNDGNGEGYVLHHSTNISNKSQTNIADFGTGAIYTTAQLLSEVTDGALWNNPCPANFVYLIQNLVPPTPKPNWIIGWFKSRSERNTEANNRIGIVTDYTLGQFPVYQDINGIGGGLYLPYDGSIP